MSWRRIPRIEGHAEHWLYHACNAPICALRKGETVGTWQASFLNLCGKTAVVVHTTAASLEQAQRYCEKEMQLMGWVIDIIKGAAK